MESKVPDDFGKPHGTPIPNGQEVLDMLDKKAGKCSVSYLFARPVRYFSLPLLNIGFSFNGFGHSAVRFRFEDGKDITMNIEGKDDNKNMVNFYETKDYLFGLKCTDNGSQGGVYNRNITEFRLNTEPEKVAKAFQFCKDLQKSYESKETKFHIALGPVYNFARKWFPNISETGNCARWTSKALKEAGIIDSVSVFPKSIGINIFEHYNPTIVTYERVPHSYHTYGKNGHCFEFVAPLQPLRQWAYGNFTHASKFRVFVPENDISAKIEELEPVMHPSKFRDVVNSKPAIGMSVIGCSYLIYKSYKRLKIRIGRFK